ncbi:hypothetical protein [Bradyrhizobium brasilense]|nr:hypothetical protein [Bradyrhizobium brasilense]
MLEFEAASAFQAEYEGSIPFTRSNDFNDLARQGLSILASRAFSF